MRLLTRGKCNKKTELTITWNQQGPQGIPGLKGDTGAKGDTGQMGAAGINGQGLFVVDAAGKTLGQLVSHLASETEAFSSSADAVEVFIGGLLWNLKVQTVGYSSSSGRISGDNSDAVYDSPDVSTRKPLARIPKTAVLPTFHTMIWQGKAYRSTTSGLNPSDVSLFKSDTSAMTSEEKATLAATDKVYQLEEVSLPTYTAPLPIVSR